MTNIIVACDNEDSKLGSFFNACAADLAAFFNDEEYVLETIPSSTLNSTYLQIVIEKISAPSFIICPYSHGESNALLCRGEKYIEKDINMHLFSGALFYSFSCLASLELGTSLVDNGCRAFVGYKNEASIWTTYQGVFVECANYAMKMFSEGLSLSSAFDKMIEKHNQEIDKMYAMDFFIASIIADNRDGLVLLGDRGVTIEDFKH